MALRSVRDRYGAVAVSIHWLSAMLIVILIGSGFHVANTVDMATKPAILRLHVLVAIGVLVLTIVRIVWWFGFDQKPAPIGGSPRWHERTARAVHILFYVLILTLIASGIGMLALSGAAPIIFGGGDGLLPNFSKYPPRLIHGIGVRLLLALLVLHISTALYHHFFCRDGLLRRMWFSKRPALSAGQGERSTLSRSLTGGAANSP
jgi:cytochrome b561